MGQGGSNSSSPSLNYINIHVDGTLEHRAQLVGEVGSCDLELLNSAAPTYLRHLESMIPLTLARFGLSKHHVPALRSLLSIILWFSQFQGLCTGFGFNRPAPDGQPLSSSFFGLPGRNATFDYIIAGGGTGGLALASRLVAANLSVAVIEAGGFYETDNSNLSVVPAFAGYFSGADATDFQPLVDWGIHTTPQAGAGDRNVHYARGKVLGGSSARNYLVYQRPTKGALQKWASEVDDESFSWANFLPYYKRSAKFTPPRESSYTNSSNPYDLDAFRPSGGPVQVSYSNAIDAFGTWCEKAFPLSGMFQIAGLNSGQLIGSSYATLTVDPKTGMRSSSESSYLQSALNNQKAPLIYKNTLATRILFDGTMKASGVMALTAGTYGTPSVSFTLSARHEVIVSAGVFQSPQLLMVSGIGNCSQLLMHNIECKLNLPGVGSNMWDHVYFGVSHAVGVDTASASLNNATLAQDIIQTYLNTGGGPDSILGTDYYAFEKLPQHYRQRLSPSTLAALSSTFPADWPELEWLPHTSFTGFGRNVPAKEPEDGKNYATIAVALVAPLSRGTVKLRSPHMWELPEVDPAWLTAKSDREVVLQAFKRQRAIWQVFVELGIADAVEAFPGPAVTSDDEIMQWIAEALLPVWHAAGTCKMGVENDTTAVVNSNALVFGTSNLRVVDASAFPFLPPGHPQSTVYALAEKIADTIITRRST